MNLFAGSGRIVNAVINGSRFNVLRFTIVASYGYDKGAERELIGYVPCIIFNPTEAIKTLLLTNKNLFVEVEGRVSRSKYEIEGEVKYSTQVIVNKDKINIIKK